MGTLEVLDQALGKVVDVGDGVVQVPRKSVPKLYPVVFDLEPNGDKVFNKVGLLKHLGAVDVFSPRSPADGPPSLGGIDDSWLHPPCPGRPAC